MLIKCIIVKEATQHASESILLRTTLPYLARRVGENLQLLSCLCIQTDQARAGMLYSAFININKDGVKTKYMEIGRHRDMIANGHIKIVITMKNRKPLNTWARYRQNKILFRRK